ncbi:MAG: ATP-dependent DNA helicase RecG [Gammaproteobacteria bacterium]|nr:ATP-dependent DNA helicase RecG [Gammaproteobacteria bacterium]
MDRPEETPITKLKGVGKITANTLNKLGIVTLQDLLFHLPRNYQDRTRLFPIRTVSAGSFVTVEGQIIHVEGKEGKRKSLICQLRDQSGTLHLRFFHFYKTQLERLLTLPTVRCFGEVRWGPYGLEIVHPEYKIIASGESMPLEQCLTPFYPACQGLSQARLRTLLNQALSSLTPAHLPEYLPPLAIPKHPFPSLRDALYFCHQPPRNANQSLLLQGTHPSQQRLAFEELVAHTLCFMNTRQKERVNAAPSLHKNPSSLRTLLIKNLPFRLTAAQERVALEISNDLASGKPMSRLLQGDVGSGKTLIAVLSLLQAVENGYQAALMAPLAILAEQHYAVLSTWLEPLGVQISCFRHGSLSQKKTILQELQSGKIQIVVGTHALFQPEVCFKNLALIVIDEQHRFGVHQRLALRQKGLQQGRLPHQLIMTATPIPRSLTMVAYASLSHSILDESPPGRKPITTVVLPNARRQEVIERIRTVCTQGEQVYWICTLIEDSEELQAQAAEKAYHMLTGQLPDLPIALLHSRIKSNERNRIMTAFKAKQLQILVATTVIEVGVDVTSACLMVIENSERLGLSQLHQLRGRVGRGSEKSFCVLLYQPPLSVIAKARLQTVRACQDGFALAEKDLELRGPGDWLGTRQSGALSFKIADFIRDRALLPKAEQTAQWLSLKYPGAVDPLIRRWVGGREKYSLV